MTEGSRNVFTFFMNSNNECVVKYYASVVKDLASHNIVPQTMLIQFY